jgi:hypothetical protein
MNRIIDYVNDYSYLWEIKDPPTILEIMLNICTISFKICIFARFL